MRTLCGARAFACNRAVYCYSCRDRIPIFQIHSHIHVDLDEVRSVYELQNRLSLEKSNMLYESFSINGDMVNKYLHVVDRLEYTYRNSPSESIDLVEIIKAFIVLRLSSYFL